MQCCRQELVQIKGRKFQVTILMETVTAELYGLVKELKITPFRIDKTIMYARGNWITTVVRARSLNILTVVCSKWELYHAVLLSRHFLLRDKSWHSSPKNSTGSHEEFEIQKDLDMELRAWCIQVGWTWFLSWSFGRCTYRTHCEFSSHWTGADCATYKCQHWDSFIADHSLFFWDKNHGRILEYKSNLAMSMAQPPGLSTLSHHIMPMLTARCSWAVNSFPAALGMPIGMKAPSISDCHQPCCTMAAVRQLACGRI